MTGVPIRTRTAETTAARPPHTTSAAATDTLTLTRLFIADYIRTPVNLALLVIVPVVFVIAVAKPMAKAVGILGGRAAELLPTASAGWAAAFLAGIAMYFQIAGSRGGDTRLALAGMSSRTLVAARLLTGITLALVASTASLAALAARTGIGDAERVLTGTLMFATVYLALGAIIGVISPTPVNGTVTILLIWLLDLVLGPAFSFGHADSVATRLLPTHFVTLWMIDLPSGHSGRLSDLSLALIWTATALALSAVVLRHTIRDRTGHHSALRPGSIRAQLTTGVRLALRDYGRNRILWVLLVALPVLFILGTFITTASKSEVIPVTTAGHRGPHSYWLPDIHGPLMAPIAIAALATIAGIFVVQDNRAGDSRLAVAGYRTPAVIGTRIATVAVIAFLATGVSVATTASAFTVRRWDIYIAGNLLLAITYALLGIVVGIVVGRVGGVFFAFLIPFVDLAIGQSPMLNAVTPEWSRFMPGYGVSRITSDATLTPDFDQGPALLIAALWIIGLAVAAAIALRPPVRRRSSHRGIIGSLSGS